MAIAVIFVPAVVHFEVFVTQCLTYCACRNYQVVGLVKGDWSQVMAVIANNAASVIVVARADHLDPEREPRIEVVAEVAQSALAHERTRMVRRNAAG